MASQPSNTPDVTLDDIGRGLPAVERVKQADPLDELELLRVEEARLKNELARSYIENVNADREMRKTYASRILKYLEVYSIVVGLMVLASGWTWTRFSLAPEVMAALVGSTAVAAIGLVGFIARGLFKPPPSGGTPQA